MRVFSIPPSAPFLRTLITALVDGELVAGFDARARAGAAGGQRRCICRPGAPGGWRARSFSRCWARDAALLPRIVALGDIDEDELAFAEAADPLGGAAELDLPPTLGELERRLTLAQLVAAWAKQLKPGDPAAAPLVVGGPASTHGARRPIWRG